jgi:hypothetical protein
MTRASRRDEILVICREIHIHAARKVSWFFGRIPATIRGFTLTHSARVQQNECWMNVGLLLRESPLAQD